MKSRRKFIKSSLLGLTAITFPNIITANINQDYDVVYKFYEELLLFTNIVNDFDANH